MKNKIILSLFFLAVLISNSFAQNTGFVKLHQNQFKLNGQDWYPVGMNYKVLLMHDNSGNTFISPYHTYGGDYKIEYTNSTGTLTEEDQFNQIVEDFYQIKNMGFNNIRLSGLGFGTRDDKNSPTSTPKIDSWGTYGAGNMCCLQYINLDPPYTELFNGIDQAIQAADIVGLKIQLLIGEKRIDDYSISPSYIDFLKALGSRYANNTTIFAYDLYNEPNYNRDESPQANQVTTKQEVCDMVTNWYDALHHSAPNQHITMGIAKDDIFLFDWELMKLDFVSLHTYPDTLDINTYNTQEQRINRVKSDIYWFSKVCSRPWIIGEIGFDASSDPNQVTSDCGSTIDQANFVRETINAARDCGASGYTYWDFQECEPEPSVTPIRGANYFGLVDKNNNFKPAVQEILNFDPNSSGNCEVPVGYFDYFLIQLIPGYGLPERTGRVLNSITEEPIPHAYIIGRQFAPARETKTYTDNNGNFALHADHSIDEFIISAVRCNVEKNTYSTYYSIMKLDKQEDLPDDLFLQNEIISTSKNVWANNSINFDDYYIVNQSGNLVANAKNSIKINTGFHAQYGSYFHAYTDPVVICGTIPNMLVANNEYSTRSVENFQQKISTESIEFYPNPASEVINIISENEVKSVEIISIAGNSHVNIKTDNVRNCKIDVSSLSAGMYLAKIKFENKVKIIHFSKI